MSVKTVPGLEIKETLQLQPQPDFDVLIAGAGVSGLYSAWRIARDWSQSPLLSKWAAARPDKRLRIAIVEWSDRIGGRIDSRIIADMEHVLAELGGMRFTESHQLLSLVVKHFNLPTETFPMSTNRQFYLRGSRFDERAIQGGYRVPYALDESERKMTPDQLTNLAIKRICNYSEAWSDANWQWIKQSFRYSDSDKVYRNVPLYDIGFWNILYRTVSNEGYDYVWDGGGYNSNTINWNAAEAMPYMLTDFSKPTAFSRITSGFHRLPMALADDLRRFGVPIIGSTRLTSFEKRGDYMEVLAESVRNTSGDRRFRTRALILAMPQRSLQLMDQRCEFFRDDRVQYTIQSVLPQPSYKLFLAYDRRWWNKPEFYPGPTITDLPLRMTYDFGSEEERGGKSGDTRTLVLASYCDMQANTFWNVLEREDIFQKPPSQSRAASREAPATMQRMARDQLVKSLSAPGAAPPKPTAVIGAYYADWSHDPYGAGYHAWAAHFKAWEVMEEVRHPMRDRHVYICGEAYSNAQGWVEGALCTAESVLEDFLGLGRFQGLPKEYPLLAPKPLKPGTAEAHPTFVTVRTPKVVF